MPAGVRQALGIASGDRVEFLVDETGVRLITPRMRAMTLWAKNHGGDAGDSTRAVRASRSDDQRTASEAEQRVADRVAAETRDHDEMAAVLFADLGL